MSSRPIDLRSDTVTRPDAEMRRAMAAAEVGDDLFEEDPTVARLEHRAAELLGHEAALFVPSGTMGNQIALRVHAPAGTEVICEAACHHVLYESGGMAALSGLQPRPVAGSRGHLAAEAVESAIAPEVVYRARTGCLSVENTAMSAGGTIYPISRLEELLAVGARHRLPVHLDGARLLNAAVALGVAPARLAAGFDSVMLSLSKGLGCPVGSILAGSTRFVGEARRARKLLGGGMRQVGIVAAAGVVALDRGFDHLAADHANAADLARGLAAIEGLEPVETPETNLLIVKVGAGYFGGRAPDGGTAPALVRRAAERSVLAVALDPTRIRFVTHRDVTAAEIAETIERLGPD